MKIMGAAEIFTPQKSNAKNFITAPGVYPAVSSGLQSFCRA